MSRRDGRPVSVRCDASGTPVALSFPGGLRTASVLSIRDHWREWFGIIEGEPERDVWQVETALGPIELHHERDAEGGPGAWTLARWED